MMKFMPTIVREDLQVKKVFTEINQGYMNDKLFQR